MNESFIIEGLAGKKTLKGTVKINGAKNAALKAMAATVLFDSPVTLNNIPDTEDIHTMSIILEKLGAKVVLSQKSLTIDPRGVNSIAIDPKYASTMRASVVLTGPLLARFGKVSFPAPGGCVIGARPIDLFINGYKKMGADIFEDDKNYTIEMIDVEQGNDIAKGRSVIQVDKSIKANPSSDLVIEFAKKTVGGTETLMMASVLGKSTVTLTNCAREPEIQNVAEWLNECGADIHGVGTETITIKGTNGKLLSPKKSYTAIPDRIEAGSYLILGALCASDLVLTECRPDHLKSLTDLLMASGVPLEIELNSMNESGGNNINGHITIKNNVKPNSAFRSFDVVTKEYPGFPTDLQAQIVTYLTQVTGQSKVTENIFEGRFKYVHDLQKMSTDEVVSHDKSSAIVFDGQHQVNVIGPNLLHELGGDERTDNELFAHDLRAGFAIVMAALVGKGSFTVNNAYFIDRGYEKMEERLSALGANIRRVQRGVQSTQIVV